jgi:hypothetical protein
MLLRTSDTDPANARLEIPFKARVLHGRLGYEAANTTFEANTPFTPILRTIQLVNHFQVPKGSMFTNLCNALSTWVPVREYQIPKKRSY